ncbi:N-acetylglucosamine-1-phosphotransferase subunits alpha/beta, partial [Thraustotheca clavata]
MPRSFFGLFIAVSLCGFCIYSTSGATGTYSTIGNIDISNDPRYLAYGPIDAVYTWVNGSDIRWRDEKKKWHLLWLSELYGRPMKANPRVKDSAASENRFRDNDELRYSVRSLQMYAPWIRHIYIVTDGQIPTWLDMSNPHVTIVPHSVIFKNTSHLPTFASPSIESNLDNIPGLSNHFIYFNDEVLLGAPVYPKDFLSTKGTQNIYFAWDAPECSSGCQNWKLGNGVCNQDCNVEICGYDLGDCTCTEAQQPVVLSNWSASCQAPPQNKESADDICALGCKWTNVGDGTCQASCNFAECGFDGGDCSNGEALELLPQINLGMVDQPKIALMIDPTSFVVVINASTLPGTIQARTQADDALIERTIYVKQSKLLLVFLSQTNPSSVNPSTVHLQHDSTQLLIDVVPYGKYLAHGYVYLADVKPAEYLFIDLDKVVQTWPSSTFLDFTIYLPFHDLPDYTKNVIKVTVDGKGMDSLALDCPAFDSVDATTETNTSHCALNATGINIVLKLSGAAKICIQNGDLQNCLVAVDNGQVEPLVMLPTSTEMKYLAPKTKHECEWFDWCDIAYDTLATRCTTPKTKLLMRSDEAAAKAKAVTLCTRLGANLDHSPRSRQETQPLLNKMCRMMNVTEAQPFWLIGCSNNSPIPSDFDMAIASSDTFGDSLRFANKVLTNVVGKSMKHRKVPSHMPHFIQKRLLTELKNHFPQEFAATSQHRFRHPNDMQFGFSYMHYVMNRRVLHPLDNLQEIFQTYIDINQNGVIDDYEIENALDLLSTSGRSKAISSAMIVTCQVNASALTVSYIQTYCPNLERALVMTPESSYPSPYKLMTEEQVTFLMLGESMGAYGQLYRARSRHTKFICINDDMNNPTPAFKAMLHDFFVLRWGKPSKFELADDETNAFGSLNEYEALQAAAHNASSGKSKSSFKTTSQISQDIDLSALWPYQLGLAIVSSAAFKRKSSSMLWQQVRGPLIMGIGAVLSLFSIVLLVLLLHLDDLDPGYYYPQRYGNIGNINLEKEAPYMGYGPIDVVYTWVNGTDPRWKAEKNYWHRKWHAEIHGQYFNESDQANVVDASAAASDNRFRDNEELRYSLRSIEKYAPWVRHVFLVTDGQVPSWLNLDCPRLTVVPHSAMFANTSHLPVFSSPAIEANLDTIPGLADHFLYFNDDVFLGAPVYPEDFMSASGIQNIYRSWEVPECTKGCAESFLGNGVCDTNCNASACAFDMGDCGCTEIPNKDDPLQEPEVVCQPPPASTEEASPTIIDPPKPIENRLYGHLCVEGCTYSWIGDGVCDQACNRTECAFDGGDCGVELFSLLPMITIPNNTLNVVMDVPLQSNVLIVNLTNAFDIADKATMDNEELIRHAILLENNMTLVLILPRPESTGTPTNASILTLNGEKGEDPSEEIELNLHLIRGNKAFQHGRWTILSSGGMDLSDISLTSTSQSHLNLEIRIPFFSIPDWNLPTLITGVWKAHDSQRQTKAFVTSCLAVAQEFDAALQDQSDPNAECVKETSALKIKWEWNVSDSTTGLIDGHICVRNYQYSNCIDVALTYGDDDWTIITPTVKGLPWNGQFDSHEDCVYTIWWVRFHTQYVSGTCSPLPVEVSEEASEESKEEAIAIDPHIQEQAKLMCYQVATRLQKLAAIQASEHSFLDTIKDIARHFKTKLGIATVVQSNSTQDKFWQPYKQHYDVDACIDYFTNRPEDIVVEPL